MAAVPEEPAEVVAVKPDPEAGTPPQPPAAPPATAAPPAPSAAAAEGETAGSAGDASSAKPSAPGPAASPAALDRQTLVAVLQFLRRSNLRESEEILRREARLLGEDLGAAALSPAGAGLPGASGGEGDASSSEALLSRVTAAAAIAIGSSVAPVASSSPGVAAATAVPPGKVGGGVVEDQPDVSAVLSAYNQQGDPTLYEEYYSGLKNFIECSLDCHRAELSQLFYPLFVHRYLELVYNQHESEAKSFFER